MRNRAISFFFIYLISTTQCQMKNRDAFVKRVINLDVKLATKNEINKFLTCVCPSVHECGSIVQFGSDILNCLSTAVPDVYQNLLSMLPGFEGCLLMSLSTTLVLSAKAASVILPKVTKVYNQMCKKVEAGKKKGKAVLASCDVGINYLLQQVNRKYIDNICMAVKDTASAKEFGCVLKHGTPIIDLNTYNCASSKANIFGKK